MTFVEWPEHAELVENRYGIPEPPTGGEHAARAAGELDVVLLPAVALDGAGNRMGMGAGVYDRTLEGIRTEDRAPLLVGVVHDVERGGEGLGVFRPVSRAEAQDVLGRWPWDDPARAAAALGQS